MYKNIFKPIKFNSLYFCNRVIAAPGIHTDNLANSGASMITLGSVPVDSKRGAIKPDNIGVEKYMRMPLCAEIDKYRKFGSKVAVELIHCGYFTRYNSLPPIGPSVYKRAFDGQESIAMDKDMINEVLNQYESAASIVKEIGADAILLHFGHGWLPAEFLSPHYNFRKDEYGGSIENRMRFPLEIASRVRQTVGKDYPIYMRISACEYCEDGISFEDVKTFCKNVQKYVDMIEVSSGLDTEDDPKIKMCTTIFDMHRINLHYAKEIKKEVNILVSTVGGMMSPQEVDDALNYVDMISSCRSFVADPYWLKKAYEGKEDDIRPCLRCNSCYTAATLRMRKAGCAVNLRYTRENEIPEIIPLAEKRKRVVIIGGGPGGMSAAITSAKRGHQTILIEKNNTLGGNIRFTDYDLLKIDLMKYKNYLINQVNKHDIDVRLNTEADVEYVKSLNPDAIIVAIGSKPMIPNIKGINGDNVIIGSNIQNKEIEFGNNKTVIIGGGTIGIEIALNGAMKGKEIYVLEYGNEIARTGNFFYKIALNQKLKELNNLHIITNAKCFDIGKDEVKYEIEGKENSINSVDKVILCAGLAPLNEEAEKYYDICYNTYIIGDCYKVRKVENAVEEGFNIAYSL